MCRVTREGRTEMLLKRRVCGIASLTRERFRVWRRMHFERAARELIL